MNPVLLLIFLSTAAGVVFLAGRARQAEAARYVGLAPGASAYPPIADDVSAAVAAPDILSTFTAAVNDTLRKLWQPPAAAAPYLDAIRAAEAKYQLPDDLLARVLHQESRFRPDIIEGRTKSSAGALGIAQFMPATAAEMGVDPLDPFSSIDGAGRYLRRLYNATGDWEKALAAYNWGIGNVQRKGLGAAPLETRNYTAQILGDVSV